MAQDIPAGKPIELKITVPDEVAQGAYVNLALINHSGQEFTIDCIYVQPVQRGQSYATATVRARVISSPQHTKRLMMALADNIKRYEQQHGEIKLTDIPAGVPGQMH
jgi:hypothetical protein